MIVRLVSLVAVLALGSVTAATRQPREAVSRQVVLISIDGFAAFHLENRDIDLPNIRALAAAGVHAASETVFPSMTHPAHTTLITGAMPLDHGVVNNRVTDRESGKRFHITNLRREESIRIPTLFDAVHGRGLRTAAFFWPETRDDAAIDDNVAEVFDAREMADPSAVSSALLSELRAAGVPIDSYFSFYDDPFGQGAADIALTKAAIHVMAARRPAFLALHLLVADKVQHEVGPDHYLSRAALTTADHCVGLIRAAIRKAGLEDTTTIVVAADHGFVTVEHEISLASVVDEPSLKDRVRWKADGWYVWGELMPAFARGADGPVLDRVLARAAATPGVARIVRPGEFARLGYPEYSANKYVEGQYLIAGDLATHLTLDATGDATRRRRGRAYHGHGYFPDAPGMRAALVMSGAGIAGGRTLRDARNVDVAPTIARILDVDLPRATGRVLTEALK